jgi:ERF superfamily
MTEQQQTVNGHLPDAPISGLDYAYLPRLSPPVSELASRLELEEMSMRRAFFRDFVRAQSQFEAATKDATNPFHKSKYADLSSVFAATRPALNANNIGILQKPSVHKDCVVISTLLVHTGGYVESGEISMPLKSGASPQDIGSAITYGKRYGLQALLGIPSEDDDGNAASGNRAPPRQEEEVDYIKKYAGYLVRCDTPQKLDEVLISCRKQTRMSESDRGQITKLVEEKRQQMTAAAEKVKQA